MFALINASSPYLSLSNMEVFIAVIDDGAVLAAGPNVADTLYEAKHEKGTPRLVSKENMSFFLDKYCTVTIGKAGFTFVVAASSTAFSVDTPSLG